MDFFIKQFSTLPILKFDTTDASKKYNITTEMWESCLVNFSLLSTATGNYFIANNEAEIIFEDEKYLLVYKFTKDDTATSGNFIGEFKIDFIGDYCGTLTLPNEENSINIFIKGSITKID